MTDTQTQTSQKSNRSGSPRDNGASEWAAEAVRDLVDQLSRRLDSIEHHMADAGRAASKKATEVREETMSYVRQRPLTALGIAAAAGAVLGWLWRKR